MEHDKAWTNCEMLAEKLDYFQTWANNTQREATYWNRQAKRVQHVVPNNVAICCVEMLRSFGRSLMDDRQQPITVRAVLVIV